jgi:hypothetical protein
MKSISFLALIALANAKPITKMEVRGDDWKQTYQIIIPETFEPDTQPENNNLNGMDDIELSRTISAEEDEFPSLDQTESFKQSFENNHDDSSESSRLDIESNVDWAGLLMPTRFEPLPYNNDNDMHEQIMIQSENDRNQFEEHGQPENNQVPFIANGIDDIELSRISNHRSQFEEHGQPENNQVPIIANGIDDIELSRISSSVDEE